MWKAIHFLLFLLVTGYAIILFLQAVTSRYHYVKLGKPVNWEKDWKKRVPAVLSQVFGHKKLLKDRKSGIMHLVMFYGFIILQFGALDILYKGITGKPLPIPGYDAFSLAQELTAVSVLIAVAYAAHRRYGERLKRLQRGWKPSIVLFFITFPMLSVLLTMSFERLVHQLAPSPWAPVTSLAAAAFSGVSATAACVLYYAFWWLHLLILLSFLIYVPQSKHFHLLVAPLNIFLRRLEPAGRLRSLDLEDENAESFGAGKIEDFTQKQLMDLYACVECGRCTNACPASNTGKYLSPMHMIVKLRDHLTEKGAAITSRSPWVPAFAFRGTEGVHHIRLPESGPGAAETAAADSRWEGVVTDIGPTMEWQRFAWKPSSRKADEISLIGDVMTEEEIWACTTCRNCEEQCPVGNEHVDKIIDMRRYLVLMEGKMPADGQRALQNIERQGNPWGLNRNDRVNWLKDAPDLRVPTVRENPDFAYLLFVGSMGSYDSRTIKVTKALVRLLNIAGVNFAILGNEERNSGDTPRRMGNELLFQQLCQENIATFKKYNVKKIVTACPHTYNTLKNEYPEFGLTAEVYHHTELLERLVREGKLVPKRPVNERIVYHDSCYLGRYNGIYEQPRSLLRAIPGVELVEMERNRENAMCCGAGGGMMWMEERQGKRVNVARVEQALAVQPTVISSACPYCLAMMEDGTKVKEADRVKTRDIAEILLESVS
ncbi:heterodisulfide reductase-related iron-sulfur binding cluster [Bacillaceae bacterium]